jgi:hypothetical protein
MNLEQLAKGNRIAAEIKTCNANIIMASYTQNDAVVIRKTYLKVNGLNEDIVVPESLFRIIGKLVLSEYQQKLIHLENELKDL